MMNLFENMPEICYTTLLFFNIRFKEVHGKL